MPRLAILAGQGDLPHMIAKAHADALFVHFEGVEVSVPDRDAICVSFEKFGALFDSLNERSIREVVFAGGLARPALNPANFDAKMMELATKFLAALQGGDDAILRAVIAAFEEHGFIVRGAHELVEGLTAMPGLLAGPAPSDLDLADIARARDLLHALGPLDVGQGAVVANGQFLGIETVQGTDAMLRFVAQTPAGLRHGARGVLVKAPKVGQDLRIDMPAIGPATVRSAKEAGLAGIVIDAGQVLIIDRDACLDAANAAGLFILARAI